MLKFLGGSYRHCDGVTRRGFLKAGALGVGSLSLPAILRAESLGDASSARRKSIIHIHLDGGPPQMDMIDPKPEAPLEYRGEFASIPTCIPGFHVSELMPQTARLANKMVFLRSLVGAEGKHDAFQCQSGFPDKDLAGLGGRPAMGCVVNKLLSRPEDSAPAFIDIMQGRPFARNSARPGFLGPMYAPFRPDISHLFQRELEPGMKNELAALGANHSLSLSLDDSLTVGRLDGRLSLLSQMDRARRIIDDSGMVEAMDEFHQQAFGILTSGTIAEALNLQSEDPRVLERYTPSIDTSELAQYTSEGADAAKKLLLARRLVEAGARCVSVSLSDFDTHSNNFPRMRQLIPIFDHAICALITDLEERGMMDDVTILAWGEFGRTPRINANGGRDHWPRVAMGMMAGGGLPGGAILGATDRYAGEATARPIHYQDVIATLYHQLGIDARATTITDPSGRPQYLVDVGAPIKELV